MDILKRIQFQEDFLSSAGNCPSTPHLTNIQHSGGGKEHRRNVGARVHNALRRTLIAACLCGVQNVSALGTHQYLYDADYTKPSVQPFRSDPLWPRTGFLVSDVTLPTDEQLSKYDVISFHNSELPRAARVQAINPDVMILYLFNPRSYIQAERTDCLQPLHMPFNATGPATAGCSVFAGHWLYGPGTTLSSSMSSTSTTAYVNDPSRAKVGQYVVIYDAPAGSFKNAEHAEVTAIDAATNRVTLSRGFKSTPGAHPAGAIMAMHQLGLGYVGAETDTRLWALNVSSTSPRDANGRTTGEAMAIWLANNYNKDSRGRLVNGVTIDGILFDTDVHFYWSFDNSIDVDNDLVADRGGIAVDGTNLWGEGLEQFYASTASMLPGKFLVGGESTSRGLASLNGVEIEGWPVNDSGGNGNGPYGYDKVDQLLSSYDFHLHQHYQESQYTHGVSRVLTKRFPMGVTPAPTTNAPFRFGLGLALLDDGFFGEDNAESWPQTVPEKWWDEYAVDVRRGLPTFAQAIASNPNDESQVRSHKGWMGSPLGPRVRLYDDTAFDPSKTLIANGTYESNVTDWLGTNVTVIRDTVTPFTGTGALRASNHLAYNPNLYSTKIQGPYVHLVAGQEYTLAFAAKAAETREIAASIGWSNISQNFMLTDTWRRFVVTVKAKKTGSERISFSVGRENTPVWLDDVYLFAGNADVFRRDFDNAVVIVNATHSQRSVNLGGTFQRIKGTGQDPINNGASVTQVTVDPHDAAILVRP